MPSAGLGSARSRVRGEVFIPLQTMVGSTDAKLWSPGFMLGCFLSILFVRWLPLLQRFVLFSCLCSPSPTDLVGPLFSLLFSWQGAALHSKHCFFSYTLHWVLHADSDSWCEEGEWFMELWSRKKPLIAIFPFKPHSTAPSQPLLPNWVQMASAKLYSFSLYAFIMPPTHAAANCCDWAILLSLHSSAWHAWWLCFLSS